MFTVQCVIPLVHLLCDELLLSFSHVLSIVPSFALPIAAHSLFLLLTRILALSLLDLLYEKQALIPQLYYSFIDLVPYFMFLVEHSFFTQILKVKVLQQVCTQVAHGSKLFLQSFQVTLF